MVGFARARVVGIEVNLARRLGQSCGRFERSRIDSFQRQMGASLNSWLLNVSFNYC